MPHAAYLSNAALCFILSPDVNFDCLVAHVTTNKKPSNSYDVSRVADSDYFVTDDESSSFKNNNPARMHDKNHKASLDPTAEIFSGFHVTR